VPISFNVTDILWTLAAREIPHCGVPSRTGSAAARRGLRGHFRCCGSAPNSGPIRKPRLSSGPVTGGTIRRRMYLAAYSQRMGAPGLTFYDDEVIEFFSPHASRKSAIFLLAIGKRLNTQDAMTNAMRNWLVLSQPPDCLDLCVSGPKDGRSLGTSCPFLF
jgi:hypothetical protein